MYLQREMLVTENAINTEIIRKQKSFEITGPRDNYTKPFYNIVLDNPLYKYMHLNLYLCTDVYISL